VPQPSTAPKLSHLVAPGGRCALVLLRQGAHSCPVKETACGAISLRRHCPDQVLGVAVQLPSCLASQLSGTTPGSPRVVRPVQLPLSPRRHIHAGWRQGGCLGPEVPAVRAERRLSASAPALAWKGRSRFHRRSCAAGTVRLPSALGPPSMGTRVRPSQCLAGQVRVSRSPSGCSWCRRLMASASSGAMDSTWSRGAGGWPRGRLSVVTVHRTGSRPSRPAAPATSRPWVAATTMAGAAP